MIKFQDALAEWQGPLFVDVFQSEISKLNVDQLFLQQALQHGSYATTDNMKLISLSVDDDSNKIYVKIGIFYNSVIPGCQCNDDPTSVDHEVGAEIEYCELKFMLDKKSADIKIELMPS